MFVTDSDTPPTNNESDFTLQSGVIFRYVTHGPALAGGVDFLSSWWARAETDKVRRSTPPRAHGLRGSGLAAPSSRPKTSSACCCV